MTGSTRTIVDGKVRYDGRTLAEWLPDVTARIVAAFDPVQIILFGSVARGDDGPDADIDLVVVLDEIRGRSHDAAVSILRCLRGLPVGVDVLAIDPARLALARSRPGVLRVALREGRIVHERRG